MADPPVRRVRIPERPSGEPSPASHTSDPLFLQALLVESSDQEAGCQSIRRGSWQQSEDELLKAAIQKLGENKWSECAKIVPTRTAKQCRDRWCNRLKPELTKSHFEMWEDQLIIEQHRVLGNRWSIIAALLPGRSPNAVKNRWYSRLIAAPVVLP